MSALAITLDRWKTRWTQPWVVDAQPEWLIGEGGLEQAPAYLYEQFLHASVLPPNGPLTVDLFAEYLFNWYNANYQSEYGPFEELDAADVGDHDLLNAVKAYVKSMKESPMGFGPIEQAHVKTLEAFFKP